MKRNDLTHFELERDGVKLKLKKGMDAESVATMMHSTRPAAPMALAAAPVSAGGGAEAAAEPENTDGAVQIKSPMVGTFYLSPGPGKDPFIKVGDQVEPDTTVAIIEAMKVMNEIKAEVSGRITRILTDDSTPVAYGQPLFEVKP